MKKLIALLLVALMVMSLAACGKEAVDVSQIDTTTVTEQPTTTTTTTPATTTEATTTEEPKEKVYYSYFGSDHSSLNLVDNVDSPCSTVAGWCQSYLYRAYPNETGTNYFYLCDLAKELPVATGDHTLQVTLREEGKWHNGDPINADTWIFTFQQALNPQMAPRMAQSLTSGECTIVNCAAYYNGECDWEDVGIKKIDDFTLEFTLEEDANDAAVQKNFCSMMQNRSVTPVYEPLWNECLSADGTTTSYGSDLDHWESCGPYIFATWDYDSIQVYEKWDEHWLTDYFHYDRAEFRIVPEMNARVELWEQGLLDSLTPDANTLEIYLDDPRLTSNGSTDCYHVDINCMNPNNPITDSVNYRKAIYHAIDRTILADKFFGHMEPIGWYVNTQAGMLSASGLTYRDSEYGDAIEAEVNAWGPYGYNVEMANEYLDKAFEEKGLPTDTKLELIAAFDASETNWKSTFEYLQEQFPVIFNGRITLKIVNYSGISTTEYKKQGDDGWDLSPNDWTRSLSRTYPYQCFYYYLSTYSGSPNNYFVDEFDAQFAHCEEIRDGAYEDVLKATQELEQLYLDYVIHVPVVQDVSYTLFSDEMVLPVATYIPNFGWGEIFGDKIVE